MNAGIKSVRLSVANNLNDISKDNPQIVIALAKKWKGQSENIYWVIKHGCRTLLKQGNHEILNLFGLSLKTSPTADEVCTLPMQASLPPSADVLTKPTSVSSFHLDISQ